MGCYTFSDGQDLWGVRNSAAINLIDLTGEGESRRLHVHSSDVVMSRIRARSHIEFVNTHQSKLSASSNPRRCPHVCGNFVAADHSADLFDKSGQWLHAYRKSSSLTSLFLLSPRGP